MISDDRILSTTIYLLNKSLNPFPVIRFAGSFSDQEKFDFSNTFTHHTKHHQELHQELLQTTHHVKHSHIRNRGHPERTRGTSPSRSSHRKGSPRCQGMYFPIVEELCSSTGLREQGSGRTTFTTNCLPPSEE